MPIHLTLEGNSYAESKQNYSTALRVFDLIVRRQRNLDEILSHLIDRQLRRERSEKKKKRKHIKQNKKQYRKGILIV